ncbi:MAG: response regulator [Oscillospiraceae bacterium]|jgi:CheY-like chemotaxis protein|nr:response regulator [Oscillospiraceae bacterium]
MKIFFLDDSKERQIVFQHHFAKLAEIIFASDIEEAKEKFLPNAEYDLIFLDHDLGDRIFVSSEDENTGAEFCRWLKNNWENSGTPIYIHSHNPVGAKNMINIIGTAKPYPFAYMMHDWKTGNMQMFGKTINDI